MPAAKLSRILKELAGNIRLSAFKKTSTRTKKAATEAEKLQEHSTHFNGQDPRQEKKMRVLP